jgi:hypothetical protein
VVGFGTVLVNDMTNGKAGPSVCTGNVLRSKLNSKQSCQVAITFSTVVIGIMTSRLNFI